MATPTSTPTPSDNSIVLIYNNNDIIPNFPTDTTSSPPHTNSYTAKLSLTSILRGGAIIETTNLSQSKLAQSSGACAVSLTSRDLRMADISLLKTLKAHLTIPIMAQCRVGHFVEAQILETSGTSYIDENECLLIADDGNFINKHNFTTPFSCGARDLGEALCRIREGAAIVRAQGDGPGLAHTVGAVRRIMGEVRRVSGMGEDEVFAYAKRIGAPYEMVKKVKQMGRLPVVVFAAGGIVSPADAALMMQLGCDGVVVGKEVWEGEGDGDGTERLVRGIVEAVRCYNDPGVLARVSSGLSGRRGRVVDDETRVVEV